MPTKDTVKSRARTKRYVDAHPDLIKARSDKYRAEHREEINARRRKRHKEGLDKTPDPILSKESKARYRVKHRKDIAERNRKRYAMDVVGSRKYQNSWHQAHKDLARDYRYKVQYGISLEDYDRMLSEQDGKCAICGRPQSELHKRLAVDHDVSSGKVRKLLCTNCNMMIGLAHHNPEVLQIAVTYLEITK